MKIALQGLISSNQAIGQDIFLVSIHCPSFSEEVFPGQFVQISTPGSSSTFLKRPISVYGYKQNQVRLIYKVVGQGTQNLSKLLPNQAIDIILPLGNSFTPSFGMSNVLLIGGGMGIAPLVYYLNFYQRLFPKTSFTLCYGVSGMNDKIDLEIPKPFPGKFIFHSDYFNDSYQGNLLDFFKSKPTTEYDLVLACGPTPMLKAFSDFFAPSNSQMEVSLESNMACGYGVCLGCSFPTTEGSKTVCVDGPVFKSTIIDWTKVWMH